MRKVVLVEGVRTAIGKRNGSLCSYRSDELLAHVLEALLKRTNFDKSLIDEVIVGCTTQVNSQGNCIGRLASLMAGIPDSVPAFVLNQKCSSSEQALHIATQKIITGYADIIVVGGVENMSLVPSAIDRIEYSPKLLEQYEMVHQGNSAELIADMWNISREELDRFSYMSHVKAAKATEAGEFSREIVDVAIGDTVFNRDEGVRANVSFEKMAQLKPAFMENGKVTAANSSQISDGASGLVLMEKETAIRLGFKPKGEVVSQVTVGVNPKEMLTGVIPATLKAIDRANVTLEEIDVFEINEAFASVVLAWIKELGIPEERVNLRGGAIALGHPTGASGARITATLLNIMEDSNAAYGLQTMCAAHGMATATVWKKYQ